MSRPRATGCTRFIFAMLIIIPLAYVASMMITGDSVNFKAMINQWLGNKVEVVDSKPEKKNKTISYKDKLNEKSSGSSKDLKNIGDFKDHIKILEVEAKNKDRKIKMLIDELGKVEDELEKTKKELSKLKK